MAPRRSIVNLLSNYACTVRQRGRLLVCRCSGWVVTAFMLAAAAICGLASIAMLLLIRVGGDPTHALVISLMGVSLMTASGHLACVRYRRHGCFELDGEHGLLRHFRVGRQVAEFDFDQIQRVSLVLDASDGMRLSGPPSWLQIGLSNGEVLRLAKGSRQELAPVCAALRELGVC